MKNENAPAPAPALTCDPNEIAGHVKDSIAALEKDAAFLPPLLGFALTSLRGAKACLDGHLQSLGKAATLLLLLGLFAVPARAQTFYGFTTLTGTNSSPILYQFNYQTNLLLLPIQSQTLQVTNVLTNETITLTYSAGLNPATAGTLVPQMTITTNFSGATGWSNFPATWTYVIPKAYPTAQVFPWGTMAIVDPTFASGTCTNGVGLQ